mgnify:CR=1 FL=1
MTTSLQHRFMGSLDGARVLVTGGSGSIGSELVRKLLERRVSHIIVFSRDDSKQFYLQQEFEGTDRVSFIIGDVRDRESLSSAFRLGVDVVIHAAALKHVLICELNPTESVKTNILGTQNVVDLSIQFGVKYMVTISTDKAVNPSSTMGATKYLAEKITVDANSSSEMKSICVRFGNVLGSRGSVIPALVNGIRQRGKIWISDPEVTRFAMPISDAASLVLDSLDLATGGEIFVLKMKAFSVGQLLDVIKSMKISDEFDVETRGLNKVEKLHEDLISREELTRLWESPSHYLISPLDESWEPNPSFSESKMELYNSGNEIRFSNEELRMEIELYLNRV